jgi:hypothetical protein
MILTPLKIQIAIIKAWYSIALKSIKYYGGLAAGINNTCLFKEIRLLRAYVDILKNFEIVGSTITCSCCVEGDYTVLLNELSEATTAKIQFSCDGTGSMYYNNIGYPFIYSYDSNNKKIVIQFSTLINPSTDIPYVLNLDTVEFTENCSFEPNTESPIEVAVIDEVLGIPVTVNNFYGDWDGNITIYETNGVTILHERTISVDIINDPEAIVDFWNSEGPEEWVLSYDGTQYTMLTPFDGIDYIDYTVVFSQYEGGVDSLIDNQAFIPQEFVPVGTRASTTIDIPNTFVGGVRSRSVIQPAIPQPFITTSTLARAEIVIPNTIFSTVQTPATMTIDIEDAAMFGSTPPSNQFFIYTNGSVDIMFNHVGPYANPAALVSGFNSNNGNGFVMSYVGPSPTFGLSRFQISSPISGRPFNNGVINIVYTSPFQSNSGTFSGGTSVKPLELTITDTLGLFYNVTGPSFSSASAFVTAFNIAEAGNYTVSLGFSSPGTNRLIFTPAGPFTAAYNNTPITFEAIDPSYAGGIYTNSSTYQGGIDTTECTYALKLYDANDNLVGGIANTTETIYTSVADIAEDIQENTDNTYRFGTGVNFSNEITTNFPYPFVLPESLTCETYNGYYFILSIQYTSGVYGDYTSNNSTIFGGINAVSNEYQISDTDNGVIFQRTLDSYNYPNGFEIEVGLVNDFNTNILLYEAEYVGDGANIPETPSTSLNNFISQLTAATISAGEEIAAYIYVSPTLIDYLGSYQAPITGILPPYSGMIAALNTNIVNNNYVPGLTSISSPSGIFQSSPPNEASIYNGRLLQIYKQTYIPATITLDFGAALSNTQFSLSIDGINICVYNQSSFKLATEVAALVEDSVNLLGAPYTAVATGSSVVITAPPFTGESYNGFPLTLIVSSGTVIIDLIPYSTNAFIDIGVFDDGDSPKTLLKEDTFEGGLPAVGTKTVRFYSPVQGFSTYGTGNFAYNGDLLVYNYNTDEYTITNNYSGGIDPTVGQFTVQILDNTMTPYGPPLYQDSLPQNYQSRQELADAFNAENPFPLNFEISLFQGSALAQYLSPPTSFDFFNTYKFRYSYIYVSSDSTGGQYTDYVDITSTFNSGEDPDLVPYGGTFRQGDIGLFVNDNPCEETIAEQECLTNNDVNKIIAHIDKLVK